MSNTTIVQRIFEVVSAFERGDAGATAIAQSVEIHGPALEAVPRKVRDRLHKLSVMIIEQDVSPLEEKMLGLQASKEACAELKILLQEIASTAKSG